MTERSALDVDLLRAAASGTQWRRVDVVEQTGSTNADLISRAAGGEDIAGSVLLAEFQSAGRGRHGRSWSAPPRSQISMSVAVDTSEVAPTGWGWLPLLTGLVVVQTVRDFGIDAALKWPNDVLVGTGKLAGILAEVTAPTVVIGLGVNVSFTEDELPDPNAVSLSMLGHNADRNELAIALLQELDTRLAHWRACGGTLLAQTKKREYVPVVSGGELAICPTYQSQNSKSLINRVWLKYVVRVL
ncbi:MAG: biotin--[acetyl-CoA-carboxylase] ligase [Actinomycetota bacterium]|nr:biotin--[acetyl-CoA-carboxylase] ligase [Actinomycetota bacterium]